MSTPLNSDQPEDIRQINTGTLAEQLFSSIRVIRLKSLNLAQYFLRVSMRRTLIRLASSPPADEASVSRLGCMGAGGLAGTVGSMIGLGGGIITVPLLRFLGLPQKKASATSLPMVVVGAAAASLSWQLNTPDGVGLDLHGALLMGSMAALFSPLGVRLSMRFQGNHVSRAMGFFMFGMGAFMVFSMVDWDTLTLKEDAQEESHTPEPSVPEGLTSTPRRALTCALLGAVVGVAGGAFGVGGGIILVPMLTQMSDVQTAAATSLAAVIPPTLMSTFVCARNNLVVWRLTPFLIASSTVASFLSAKFAASRLTHTQQKGTFVAVMCSIGTRLMLIKS